LQTTEDIAELFFINWYCENGLPTDILSDWDKLFFSHFWQALHKLMGIQSKFLTSYHPKTNGSSKWTNKTVNQCIGFHVKRNQKGWVNPYPLSVLT
jgi:hypothetical protein